MTSVRHSPCVLMRAPPSATWADLLADFRAADIRGRVGVVILGEEGVVASLWRLSLVVDCDEAASVVCEAFDEINHVLCRSIYREESERLDWDASVTPLEDIFAWMERENRPVFLGQPEIGRSYMPLCAHVSSRAGVEILLRKLRESYGEDFSI